MNGESGFLLLTDSNKTLIEYTLYGYQKPIGVADWQK